MRKLIQKINGPQSCDKKVLSESLKEVFHKKKIHPDHMIHITHCVNNQVHVKKKVNFEKISQTELLRIKTIHVFDRKSFTNGPKSLKIGDLIPLV